MTEDGLNLLHGPHRRRAWRAVLPDQHFNRPKVPLRLPYAVANDFAPGIWRPEDVKIRKENQTFAT